ncbi:Polyglutamate biosynthesis protein, partial [Aspergillus sclerotialis]
MHPANAIAALNEAKIDYVCLANNHTLDFGTDGLVETVWTVKQGNIAFAGAGETTDESRRPAVLSLPRGVGKKGHGHAHGPRSAGEEGGEGQGHKIHVYSASDHPTDWAAVPTFHLIDYSATTRRHLKNVLTAAWPSPRTSATNADSSPMSSTSTPIASTKPPAAAGPALKIFSVHWGPNYKWQPAAEIRSLAHFVIDECGVDIVHGHSSHHIQGVEKYK